MGKKLLVITCSDGTSSAVWNNGGGVNNGAIIRHRRRHFPQWCKWQREHFMDRGMFHEAISGWVGLLTAWSMYYRNSAISTMRRRRRKKRKVESCLSQRRRPLEFQAVKGRLFPFCRFPEKKETFGIFLLACLRSKLRWTGLGCLCCWHIRPFGHFWAVGWYATSAESNRQPNPAPFGLFRRHFLPLAAAAAVTATRPGTYPSPASPLCCQQVAYCARHKKARIGAKGRKSGLQKNEGNVVVVVGTMADSAIVSGPFIKYLTTMTTMRGLTVCL